MEPLAHASIAIFAKPFVPKAPLWALVAGTFVLDAVSYALIGAGVEKGAETQMDFANGVQWLTQPHFPWSHGLSMALVWAALIAAVAYLLTRDRRVTFYMGLMVFSHWILDAIAYPNMPVFFSDTPQTGLGLIASGPGLIAGIVLEVGLIIGGIVAYVVYRRNLKGATHRHGR
jgi:membrane-bound metal-dependent hydrolase YbcI (DUF457 family)